MTKYPAHKQEDYLHGRKAGVEGTYGEKRKGLVEKTVLPKEESDSGARSDVSSVAKSLHRKALRNDGSGGDPALSER